MMQVVNLFILEQYQLGRIFNSKEDSILYHIGMIITPTENNTTLISTSIVDTAFAYVPVECVCTYLYIHSILME